MKIHTAVFLKRRRSFFGRPCHKFLPPAPPVCTAVALLCLGAAPALADSGYQPYYYPAELSDGKFQSFTVTAKPAAPADTDTAPAASTLPPAPKALPTTSRETNFNYQAAPSYPPATDARVAPYATPKANDPAHEDIATSGDSAAPKTLGVGTLTGFELGVQLSGYRYQEHDVAGSEFMHIAGPNFGVTFGGYKSYGSGYFWGADARLTYGKPGYKGADVDSNNNSYPSTANHEDFMADLRGVFGHDFIIQDAFWGATDVGLSPYIGLGFRYLSDVQIGEDSLGADGYARYSHYIYLPVGVTPRFRVSKNQRVAVNMEYDQLLYGWQMSELSDIGYGDLTNSQHDGFGLRGSIMYEWPSWEVGPFFNYWNINQSNTSCADDYCGEEPHNQTIEYGVQGRYRF